ncbi:MAG: alanine:cation symporter family protein [Candidatus Methanomethylophilaceae archaeon]|nr:alanine:cation symporter family protein [Candidatus Methanomethylophilaceae archaeon]
MSARDTMSGIDDIQDKILDFVDPANTLIWHIAFVFVIGLGIAFTIKLRGVQLTRIRESAKLATSGVSDGKHNQRLSSFEAFCVGMGARIGVGNIAGVATAIVTGGPGAVFWMWIFAIIGAASSFMESTLAQIYKEKKSDGGFHGGPAYYAYKGLGSRTMGIVLAILIVFTFGIGFVAVQAANASSALTGAFDFEGNNIVFALIIAGLAAAIIFSGVKMAGKFSAKVVPFMALAWIVFALIAICLNFSGVANAFVMIFEYAFSLPSLLGGAIGTIIMVGLKRGVFSNEAGLGSVANVAATADVKHPAKQGLIQGFGVLVDTLLICTITALVVLSYGSFEDIMAFGQRGAPLVQSIVSSTAIGDIAPYLIAMFMFVFAFTSLVGYYTMSEANARFVRDKKAPIMAIRILVIAVAFIAAYTANMALMDGISDTFMAVMGAVNMIVVAMLSRKVFECYRDYRRQKKAGIEEPEFHRSALSDDTGVTEWE